MSLLSEVVAWLDRSGVPHCLIGAAALAVHGAPRSTQDDDLLVVDLRVLEEGFWGDLGPAVVRSLRGDADDPLAGAVRLRREAERNVDVVIGRWRWQRDAIERARVARLPDLQVPVVDPADLVLLKLDAGGPQDRRDIETLLGLSGLALATAVEERLKDAHSSLAREWARIRG